MRRFADDRIADSAGLSRRFRCADAACGFEGLLDVSAYRGSQRRLRALRRKHTKRRRLVAFGASLSAVMVLAVGGTAGWRAYQLLQPDPLLEQLSFERASVPAGRNHEGVPLPADHPLRVAVTVPLKPVLHQAGDASRPGAPSLVTGNPTSAPSRPENAIAAGARSGGTGQPGATGAAELALRKDCAWGDPGRDPYTGTVEQALRAARLPEGVRLRLQAMIESGEASDRLEITRDAIRAVHRPRSFDPNSVAMTFGKTLCVNTKVNFKKGHMERADLYEVADENGATYSVMVPYVCGNVSVLGDRAERPEDAIADAPIMVLGPDGQPILRRASAPLPGVIAGVIGSDRTIGAGGPGGPGGGGPGGSATQPSAQVPEPGTLASFSIGAAVLGLFLRRRARQRALTS